MNLTLLHSADAAGEAPDPVLAQIESALVAGGHTVQGLAVTDDVSALVHALRTAAPDLVINLVESFAGKSAMESGVAALLSLLGLRYTGSSPSSLALAGDKSVTKKVLAFHGIRTPEFATLYRGAVDWAGELDFPLIVKPPQEDASLGISTRSVVRDIGELLRTMGEIQAIYQQPVLVEQFIDGREFYVGVLGNQNAVALPIIELDFSGMPPDRPKVASFEAKWGDASHAEFAGTRSIVAEALEPELAESIQRIALEAFHALRLRDYARIDLRVTDAGEIYVIEVNPNCYLERSGEFARAAECCGIAYDALVQRIVELAAARYAR